MTEQEKDAVIISVLVKRLETQRLPRALDLKTRSIRASV